MHSTWSSSTHAVSSSEASKPTLWSRLNEVLGSFDCAITKHYVAKCMELVEKVVSKAEPHVRGADLIAAIQSEMPIPTSTLELHPTGLLGMCVNIITIVSNAEEDPIECISKALNDD
jgi:hypothetical protein